LADIVDGSSDGQVDVGRAERAARDGQIPWRDLRVPTSSSALPAEIVTARQ